MERVVLFVMTGGISVVPRMDYVSKEHVERVIANAVASIEGDLRELSKPDVSRRQLRLRMLAGEYETLANFWYALGIPLDDVRESLVNYIHNTIEACKLRGTAIVVYNGAEKADFSMTGSHRVLPATYVALALGGSARIHEVATWIWDPPDASYVGKSKQSLCRYDCQRLAYALREYLAGNHDQARIELKSMLVLPNDEPLYSNKMLLTSILKGDRNDFLDELTSFLEWNRQTAKQKRHIYESEYYIRFDALAFSRLALESNLIDLGDLAPLNDVHFPLPIAFTKAEDAFQRQ